MRDDIRTSASAASRGQTPTARESPGSLQAHSLRPVVPSRHLRAAGENGIALQNIAGAQCRDSNASGLLIKQVL